MKRLKEAYIGYMNSDNIKCGVKIKVLHSKLDPQNFNKLDYIRYVSNAFSYMISLQAYWSNRYNRHEETIIVSDENLADAIGCHVKHSSKVLKQLQKIFKLDFKRLPERGGAREITINERVIEFMKVYNDNDLHEYMNKYEINDKNIFKAFQQLYRYRAWGVKDTQLSVDQVESKRTFLKKNKNFFHRAITNNRTDYQRLDYVRGNKDKLSSLNETQLERILEEKKQGKLSHYWNLILIKLEQKVSKLLRKATESNRESTDQTTTHVNQESKPGETEQHASATRQAQKVLESDEVTPAVVMEIMVKYNNMILDQAIPEVTRLTSHHINLIDKTVKSIGKKEVLKALNKVSQLVYDSTKYETKLTFKRFMNPEYIKWINTTIQMEDVAAPEWFAAHLTETTGVVTVPYIDIEETPELSSNDDVIKYWNQLKN